MYLTLFIGLILPVIVAAVIRKKVTAPAWPRCQECRDERRRNLMLMWASVAAWVPGLVLVANLAASLSGSSVLLLLLMILLLPLVGAVWFHGRAAVGREIGGEVSPDGATVSFPGRVFPPAPPTAPATSVPSEDPAAFFGG